METLFEVVGFPLKTQPNFVYHTCPRGCRSPIACHVTVSGKSTVLCLCVKLVYFRLQGKRITAARYVRIVKRLVGLQGLGWLVVRWAQSSDAAPRDGSIQSRNTLPPTMNVNFGNDARNPHLDGGRVGIRPHATDETLLHGVRRASQ